jgi:uncharacterized RDD family membrane protein YckC
LTQTWERVARRVHGSPPPVVITVPEYAGLVTRAIAGAVDAALVNAIAAIVAAATALVISVFPVSHQIHTVLVAIGGVAFFIWVVAYFTTFWSTTGQTPGNRLMEIRVTRDDGGPLKPRWALLRVIGVGLAVIPLFAGFLPILFTERRRGLQDWLADTVVVRVPRDPQPSMRAVPRPELLEQ